MTQKQQDTIKELKEQIRVLKKLNRPFSINKLNILHDGLSDTLIRLKSKQIKEPISYYHKVKQLKSVIEKILK